MLNSDVFAPFYFACKLFNQFYWKVEQTTLIVTILLWFFSLLLLFSLEMVWKLLLFQTKTLLRLSFYVIWSTDRPTSAKNVYCCQLWYKRVCTIKKKNVFDCRFVVLSMLCMYVLTDDKHRRPMTKTLAFQYQFAMFLFVIKALGYAWAEFPAFAYTHCIEFI